MLKILNKIPEELLSTPPEKLEDLLGAPTLIHMQGRREEPLFLSTLLHGNEPTGFIALQKILQKYSDQELPRSLSIFLGNLSAARHAARRLDDQPDYNRVWPGTDAADSPEKRMMKQIMDEMLSRNVFASVDIHNNTGLNPHYACINVLENPHMQLATLFSRTVVYFIRPVGVQSAAFAPYCPSVTLECGKPGEKHGVEHALEFIDACLHLSQLPEHPVAEHDIDLFHTMAQVKVPENISFSFSRDDVQIRFVENLERMNFQEVPPATIFAFCRNGSNKLLVAKDETGQDVSEMYFQCIDNRIELKKKMMPSMLTLDEEVIRQDCLCYLMERMDSRNLDQSFK
ncbi:MAG TPA: peptidase M14 [Chromatiales bacterium]|nr:peptidase M14 [Chromatiales bacterium]